jgi:hypothetical protein|tara:strand:- start:553 stop:1470 length:918 start_codon:yes stop_codon:yes gene_type:complete
MLSEIVNEEYKKQVIFLLNNNWTGRTDYYFPVQISVNLEKSHFTKLKYYNYIYAKKNTTDAKRGILFTFINSNAENVSIIIFKDFTMYNIYINCYHEYFYGSIFDISFTEENITICDVFMIGGNKVNTYSYLDRISEAEYFVNNTLESETKLNTLKHFHCISDILNASLNENEELFMIPNNLPITTGINYSCFKWKPADRHTFNLLFEDDDFEDINVYTTNFKKMKHFAKIRNNTPEGIEYIKTIRSLENYKSGCIIEVGVDNNKMDIIKVSVDKKIPTTIRAIEKILYLKKENITIEDIINLKK